MARTHKRYLKNYLVSPRFQFKFIFYFWASGLCVLGVFLVAVHRLLETIRNAIAQSSTVDFEVLSMVNSSIAEMSIITLLTVFGYTFVSFVYASIISHRVAGPMVAIRAYISELKKGNYEAHRPLRKYDELQPIMSDLKELAEDLKLKKNS